jgi:hypothetical protein
MTAALAALAAAGIVLPHVLHLQCAAPVTATALWPGSLALCRTASGYLPAVLPAADRRVRVADPLVPARGDAGAPARRVRRSRPKQERAPGVGGAGIRGFATMGGPCLHLACQGLGESRLAWVGDDARGGWAVQVRRPDRRARWSSIPIVSLASARRSHSCETSSSAATRLATVHLSGRRAPRDQVPPPSRWTSVSAARATSSMRTR